MLRSRILRRLLPFRSQSLQRSPLESFPAGLGTARALSSAVLSQPLTESDGPNRAPWGLFFSRGSKFASGYSALTRKPLDSIMNVESVKYASPEELTTIWNEVRELWRFKITQFTKVKNRFRSRASVMRIPSEQRIPTTLCVTFYYFEA